MKCITELIKKQTNESELLTLIRIKDNLVKKHSLQNVCQKHSNIMSFLHTSHYDTITPFLPTFTVIAPPTSPTTTLPPLCWYFSLLCLSVIMSIFVISTGLSDMSVFLTSYVCKDIVWPKILIALKLHLKYMNVIALDTKYQTIWHLFERWSMISVPLVGLDKNIDFKIAFFEWSQYWLQYHTSQFSIEWILWAGSY